MAKKNPTAAAETPAAVPTLIPVRMREDAKQAWTHAGKPVKPGQVIEVTPDIADRVIGQGIAEVAQPA